MIYQHGSYVLYANGSIVLYPIASDGRKLWSDPCTRSDASTYTRYNQTELYKVRYEQSLGEDKRDHRGMANICNGKTVVGDCNG
jgi:hypothetical protein